MSRYYRNNEGYLMVCSGDHDDAIECLTSEDWNAAIRREWKIPQIVARVKSSEKFECIESEDSWAQALFLGTMINPSGKFYLPFACSNVVGDCPLCGGTGALKNPVDFSTFRAGNVTLEKALELRASLVTEGTMFVDWPEDKKLTAGLCDFIRNIAEPELQCPRCEGSGSQSAYDDELWQEEFERILDEHDICLVPEFNGNEGYFAVKYTPVEAWYDNDEEEENEDD